VIRQGNYVTVSPSRLGNFVIVHTSTAQGYDQATFDQGGSVVTGVGMSRRRTASIGGGVTFVMAGAAGAAGGQLAGNPWAWVCLGIALLVGGLATAWTTWRTTDSPTPPALDDPGNPPERVQVGTGGMFSGRNMTIRGGVSTASSPDVPADPAPATGPGWQVGPGAIAAGQDMEIGGDVHTRTDSAGGSAAP
jgi:hypothetical protein